MLVVRAIQSKDLDGLMNLATQVGGGMTTLKADRRMLGNRVDVACASFAEEIPPEQRDYLFVMEDTTNAALVGVCAIKSAVGLEEPFYNYRIGTLVHSSNELKVFSRMETLYLSNDLTGCSELCSLFLHPDYRSGTNGKLLSKSRLLFIAQFPHLFAEKLIAEMRGFLRPDGTSPFWDSLGQHFFKMEFERADDLYRRIDAASPALYRLPATRGAGRSRPGARRDCTGAPSAGTRGHVLRRLCRYLRRRTSAAGARAGIARLAR